MILKGIIYVVAPAHSMHIHLFDRLFYKLLLKCLMNCFLAKIRVTHLFVDQQSIIHKSALTMFFPVIKYLMKQQLRHTCLSHARDSPDAFALYGLAAKGLLPSIGGTL